MSLIAIRIINFFKRFTKIKSSTVRNLCPITRKFIFVIQYIINNIFIRIDKNYFTIDYICLFLLSLNISGIKLHFIPILNKQHQRGIVQNCKFLDINTSINNLFIATARTPPHAYAHESHHRSTNQPKNSTLHKIPPLPF